MNNSIKKLSIFSLAAGVGQMIHDQADDDKIKWRSSLLAKSGNEALATCKAKIDASRLNQVKKKIDAVCEDKEKFDTVNMLSFLLTGLDDLQAHCKRKSGCLSFSTRSLKIQTFSKRLATNIQNG